MVKTLFHYSYTIFLPISQHTIFSTIVITDKYIKIDIFKHRYLYIYT